jgi:DNA ligase D-like protein (predicted ligase)
MSDAPTPSEAAGQDPGWLSPMLAQPSDLASARRVLLSGDWVYQRKLDGLRCVASVRGSRAELWSRNRLSFNARFHGIVDALERLPLDDLLIDGEIVAFDNRGATSFSLLQSSDPGVEPVYCAFDVIRLLGVDTTELPLTERAVLLRRVLSEAGPAIRAVEQMQGDATDLLAGACAAGWEGLVAKRASSPYRSGRSPDWRKLKCSLRQELVVGGWTDPSGSRIGFGALLLGYYDLSGSLSYAGRVGTGFDARDLRSIHDELRNHEIDDSAFADAPPDRHVHWSTPTLVAEVSFTEWTRDGRLRHPSFVALREDKSPWQVRREDANYPDPA